MDRRRNDSTAMRGPYCVITDYMGDDTALEEKLLGEAGFEVFVAPSPDPSHWLTRASEADALLTRHAPISRESIDKLRRCRVIARYGTGHDNIDVEAALGNGIVVTNVPGYCTDEVADHAMTLLLMGARRIDVLTDSVRSGGWTPAPLPPMRRIRGQQLGLIGLGRIGIAVASRANAFGLTVSAYDPFVDRAPEGVALEESLEQMLAHSNFVSLHVPLDADTEHILNRERISLLPKGACVVNVARGGLLDLNAAYDALESQHLSALAIDVAEQEPLPKNHPARNKLGLIVTPHVGYYSTTSVIDAKRNSVAEILRVTSGQLPENPVHVSS